MLGLHTGLVCWFYQGFCTIKGHLASNAWSDRGLYPSVVVSVDNRHEH